MIEDAGNPKVGDTARTLGVRINVENVDIVVDANGMVHPNTGGMSVSPRIADLLAHRRLSEFGGTGKDPVWRTNINDLGPELVYVSDSPTHGTIQPTKTMTIEEYQKALANIKWRKVECQ